MTEAAEKKDVQKLQRVIVDALEDVKAVNIAVYNTEHLSSLFERVILASGTSNRQTKALAANVRDEVRKSGHGKPRIEGEENGEWIIVDCGAAVVHIMQPNIREYYNLEEIWGDKPVRLKFGAPRPVFAQAQEPKEQKKASSIKTSSKTGSKTGSKTPSKTGSGKTSPPARPGSSRASAAPKNSRSRKGASRGLQTAVDPKTGLTVPVNNSRRAIDKRPYLAELPAESPKASAQVKGTQKTSTAASKSKATPPLKSPLKASSNAPSKPPSRAPAKAPARSSSPVSGKTAPKPRAAAPGKPAAKRTTKKA
ncbi:MAG: ribosome silencing factor [Burkholderiaceae bacterium]